MTNNSESICLDTFYKIIPSKSFKDKTTVSKYSDKLAIIAFSLNNLQIMMNNSEDSHFYFLLPFSLWEAVLYSNQLNVNTRKNILEIIKYIFYLEYLSNSSLPEKPFKKNPKISFYSKGKIRRIIVTIIGLFFALERYPCGLALNRISSHPIENTFGITRSTMQNKIGVDAFISSLSSNILKRNILEELEIEIPQYKKITDAGTYLNGFENLNINFDLLKIKNEIVELRKKIDENQKFEFNGSELKFLVNKLCEDASLKFCDIERNNISGSSILARNIASSHFLD